MGLMATKFCTSAHMEDSAIHSSHMSTARLRIPIHVGIPMRDASDRKIRVLDSSKLERQGGGMREFY